MFSPEKFDQWQKAVERKIVINKTNTEVTEVKNPETETGNLRVSMERKDNGRSDVFIEYSTEITDKTEGQFILLNMKWYTTHLLLEQTLVKREEGKSDEELSYGAAIYSKFSGVKTTDSNGKFNKLVLLYGKEEEILPLIIEKKDARKLMELICSLG